MNAAVSVYVNAAKTVLQSTELSTAANVCSNNELPRQLLSLRQLLSCVVCCRLATDPFSPNHGRCPHSVCRLCIRGQKNLHPSCPYCNSNRDFKTYDENKQLRCLLVCYKSLCEHLRSSAVFPLLAGRKLLQYNVMSPMLSMPQMSLQDLIVEGASYDDILSTFTKDLPKPMIYLAPKQQPQMPALVAPLTSTSAATPLAPIQQNIKSSGFNQVAPKAATPPTSVIGPISSLPLTHATKVKVETSTPQFKPQSQSTAASSISSPATPASLQSSTTYSHHPHLIQLNQLKNTSNITYIGPNTRGIVTVPLSIASARLQTLNRQLAQARALQVVSSAATPSSTTNPTIVTSSAMDVRPQLAAFKVSLASTQPTKSVSVINTSSSSVSNTITTAVTSQIRNPPPIKTVSNGSAMYSVLYTGIGNKITIKRKTDGDEEASQKKNASTSSPNVTILRPLSKANNKKRGCRCGNTTATPGKLTCCGQRCPCYVDSKSCIGCKCRGCRNPHRPDGNKVRPVIPELACYEIQMADDHANVNELPIATTSGIMSALNGDGSETTATTHHNLKSAVASSTSEAATATLIPIRHQGLQQTARSSPLPPLTSATMPAQQTTSMTQASSLGSTSVLTSTTTPTQGNIVQLEQMQRESLLIQNAEGKFQVVNLFTTGTGQSQVAGLQRLQTLPQTVVSVSGSNNFILPSTISTTTSHSGTSTTTSLPQFILQSQHQQQQQHQAQQLLQQHHNQQHQTISTQRIQTATLPLHLQQQLKQNNIITVHTIGSNTNANTSPATASVLTPSSSPAPTTATLTLAPLIINNAQNQKSSSTEMLEDCGDVNQRRYANIVVSSGTTSIVRDVITSSLPVSLSTGTMSHHNTAINLKTLETPNV